MNQAVRLNRNQVTMTPPVELDTLGPAPLLLPGETLENYRAFRQAIFADIGPQSAVEWQLAIDVAEACWEILRYRLLRHSLLEVYRQTAVETALRRIDLAGIAPDSQDKAAFHISQNALSWRLDPTAATEIEERLFAYGFDQHAVSVEVYIQARETFVLLESLINGAQIRRTLLLREIRSYRLGR
ncbi:hypothetical protein [Bradyrhizobium lablabi]|uniref:hypothetical protein n=1 Tax=Bradyrhizobium lablabi TaxID=722472 RepID=UPI00090A8F3A|nr:hypothetical protein [Bradyrhizobium lablabi]SHM84897.1 hypothetical protein SAMN05444321_7891 [Bradyrhizobium lablabi]